MGKTKQGLILEASIDPGIGGTAIALWNHEEPNHTKALVDCVMLEADGETWICKAMQVGYWTREYLTAMTLAGHAILKATIEFQELYGTAKSQTAGNRQDLFKLSFVTGIIAQNCSDNGAVIRLVNPSEWQGQLPFRLVQKRVEYLIGLERLSELKVRRHMYSAIGIGLWKRGVFL